MSIREKQRAIRKTRQNEEDEFQKATGIRKPDTMDEKKERFFYEMARMEVKEKKIKDANTTAEYADLTVTDDDLDADERDRFQNFLKQRKEDKELGDKFYGDNKALREKEGYDDDYQGVAKEEMSHMEEEHERIEDLLKKQKEGFTEAEKKERWPDHDEGLFKQYHEELKDALDETYMETLET